MPPPVVSNYRVESIEGDPVRVKIDCYNPVPDLDGFPGVTKEGKTTGKNRQDKPSTFHHYVFYAVKHKVTPTSWMLWVEGAGNKTLMLLPGQRYIQKKHQQYPEQTVNEIAAIIATLPTK